MIRVLLLAVAMIATGYPAAAEENEAVFEMARADIRAGRMGMVKLALGLTPEQAEIFQPIYEDYAQEQDELLDQRIAMLTEFARDGGVMTEERALAVAEESFAIQGSRLDRRQRYFKRIAHALDPMIAARFIQVDSQMSTLIDFEIMRNTPLLVPASGAE